MYNIYYILIGFSFFLLVTACNSSPSTYEMGNTHPTGRSNHDPSTSTGDVTRGSTSTAIKEATCYACQKHFDDNPQEATTLLPNCGHCLHTACFDALVDRNIVDFYSHSTYKTSFEQITGVCLASIAIAKDNYLALYALLNHGVSPNADGSGAKNSTLLHQVVQYGSLKCLLVLLACKDILVNAQDANGDTSLHLASRYGKFDMLQALLAQVDIKPNIINRCGSLPLHETLISIDTMENMCIDYEFITNNLKVKSNNPCAELLLKAGSSITAIDP
ncbi:MAG: ankyrin repeat domain-containing protein [Amoebophilaceae bacterium]|nr:ankyrin repeat domain-containing protein [Amoebophilaceae bacterium]